MWSGFLAFLPALRPEDGFIDLEGDDDETDKGSDLEYHLMPTRTEQPWDPCHRCCTELEDERDVIRMCQTFALKIVLGFYLPGHSPLPITGHGPIHGELPVGSANGFQVDL